MKADNINLLEFLGSSKRTFNIPVYQRNYDWKKENCKRLFDDLIKIIKLNKEGHFLGTIVYVDGDKSANFREFVVIDGQQRLTSTMLLLKVLYECIEDEYIRQDILEDYLINKRAPERLRLKLKPIKSDFDVYNRIINDEDLEEEHSNLYNNYKYFHELIELSEISPKEIFKAVQKLEIVYIQLDSEKENPQLIFESLNSTGLDLSQADLIRNFLLMGEPYERQDYLYKQYWIKIEMLLPSTIISDFIRSYITLKNQYIPNKDKVYEEFKLYVETLGIYDVKDILIEILSFAKFYSYFVYCNCKNNKINDRLEQLQRLKSTTAYPFILSIFEECYSKFNIDEDEVVKCLDVIISYVFRRIICDIPKNALNKIFASLHKDVLKIEEELSLHEKVFVALLNKKGKAIFPRDENFKEKFVTKDVYNFKQNKYLLEKLECKNSKERIDFNDVTIEHIMPQALTPKWQVDLGKRYKDIHTKYLHRVGNLTLSGYNGELSNKSYSEKKRILEESNIYLNRELIKYEYWNEDTISKRGHELFKKAKVIWPLLDVKINSINDNDIRNEFELMEDNNVTGREPYEINIVGERIIISSWREFFRMVCSKMYEYDGELFDSLLKHKDFEGRRKTIIAKGEEELKNPFKISDNVYIEQNLSANDALNYSKLIVEKFEGMEDEIKYKIR